MEVRVFDASPLNCSPVHQRARVAQDRAEGKEEREREEITIKRFRLSSHSMIRRMPGSDCEALAEIFTTNFAQQFEPDGPRSGRSINDQAPIAGRDCHVNT